MQKKSYDRSHLVLNGVRLSDSLTLHGVLRERVQKGFHPKLHLQIFFELF